jgi:Family of unknown function (DUF6499)
MTWLIGSAAPQVYEDAAMSDWAWEYLRRNGDYRWTAEKFAAPILKFEEQRSLPIFHTSAADEQASVWGLCSFRRP